MARRLLAEAGEDREVRVVYDFSRLESTGSGTQYMKLTDADLDELEKFLGR